MDRSEEREEEVITIGENRRWRVTNLYIRGGHVVTLYKHTSRGPITSLLLEINMSSDPAASADGYAIAELFSDL